MKAREHLRASGRPWARGLGYLALPAAWQDPGSHIRDHRRTATCQPQKHIYCTEGTQADVPPNCGRLGQGSQPAQRRARCTHPPAAAHRHLRGSRAVRILLKSTTRAKRLRKHVSGNVDEKPSAFVTSLSVSHLPASEGELTVLAKGLVSETTLGQKDRRERQATGTLTAAQT